MLVPMGVLNQFFNKTMNLPWLRLTWVPGLLAIEVGSAWSCTSTLTWIIGIVSIAIDFFVFCWSVSSKSKNISKFRQQLKSTQGYLGCFVVSLKNGIFFWGAQQFLPLDHPATTVRVPNREETDEPNRGNKASKLDPFPVHPWHVDLVIRSCPPIHNVEVLKLLVFLFHFCKAHRTYKSICFQHHPISLFEDLAETSRISFNIGCYLIIQLVMVTDVHPSPPDDLSLSID